MEIDKPLYRHDGNIDIMVVLDGNRCPHHFLMVFYFHPFQRPSGGVASSVPLS